MNESLPCGHVIHRAVACLLNQEHTGPHDAGLIAEAASDTTFLRECERRNVTPVPTTQLAELTKKAAMVLRNAKLNAPGCDGAYALLREDVHALDAALRPFRSEP